jgi:hypothetical protein
VSKTAVSKGITPEDISHTRHWLTQFARDARAEVPTKLHTRTPGGLGAAPPFTDAFVGYIGELTCKVDECIICRQAKSPLKQQIVSEDYKIAHRSQSPNRTTRALRKLRRAAPLEFDVLYLAIMQRLTINEIVDRLNERAARKGNLDEVYDAESVTILAVCGADKMSGYY